MQPVWHLKVQAGYLSLHHLQPAEGQAGLEGVPGYCGEPGDGAAQGSETSETRSAQAQLAVGGGCGTGVGGGVGTGVLGMQREQLTVPVLDLLHL